MQLQLKYNLPFVTIQIEHNNKTLPIPAVLIDTGSASTFLSVDLLLNIGIQPDPFDKIHTIRGVGGTEVVFRKNIQLIALENFTISNFDVEIGSMDYGFEINGILGMDFLLAAGIKIDLQIYNYVLDYCIYP